MIKTIRERFDDNVEYFTDFELAYILGYEQISMDKLCEPETLWKLRSWGKYEDYLDAAEEIFDDDEYVIFTDKFYKQNRTVQIEAAKKMLQLAGYPMFLAEDNDIWVKRIDWK